MKATLIPLLVLFFSQLASGQTTTQYAGLQWVRNDLEVAWKLAKAEDKPLLIHFTCWACASGRKMEDQVFTQTRVQKLMSRFVVLELYVDDRTEVHPDVKGKYVKRYPNGEEKNTTVNTIGDYFSFFQIDVFKNNSQPYFAVIDPQTTCLFDRQMGYTLSEEAFAEWLEEAGKSYVSKKCSETDDNLALWVNGGKRPTEADTAVPDEEYLGVIYEDDTKPGWGEETRFTDPPATGVVTGWQISITALENDIYQVDIKAKIKSGWHVYAHSDEEGPIPFALYEDIGWKLHGDPIYLAADEMHDPVFDSKVVIWKNELHFQQLVKFEEGYQRASGYVEYFTADDERALPPNLVDFVLIAE